MKQQKKNKLKRVRIKKYKSHIKYAGSLSENIAHQIMKNQHPKQRRCHWCGKELPEKTNPTYPMKIQQKRRKTK